MPMSLRVCMYVNECEDRSYLSIYQIATVNNNKKASSSTEYVSICLPKTRVQKSPVWHVTNLFTHSSVAGHQRPLSKKPTNPDVPLFHLKNGLAFVAYGSVFAWAWVGSFMVAIVCRSIEKDCQN